MNSNTLPPFSTLDLTKVDCFISEENKSMESVPQNYNYTEDDFANMPMDIDIDMDLLYQHNGLQAYLFPEEIPLQNDIEEISSLDQYQTLTEIGTNQEYNQIQPPSQEEPKVIVMPVDPKLTFQTPKEITVHDFVFNNSSCFLTPPQSVCSSDEDIIVCNDKTIKISKKDLKYIDENIDEIKKLIKKPSKRGRPKKALEELKKVTEQIDPKNVRQKKIAKNNEASCSYRERKTLKRKELDEQLKNEIEKFENLKKIHEQLKSEILNLQLICFSNI
ncbi:hypothetical protein PVAND_009263 [Polypedilum vanderplanki]|uniref:BZIP domain-containing protein n=1 Tax=Polypedilum vanderplanki TaxID=319348 RepID=A0A9J6CC30_POLVA|nr:hypothetical protein PVAND_009263 [Polypedilum vanderplanki]